MLSPEVVKDLRLDQVALLEDDDEESQQQEGDVTAPLGELVTSTNKVDNRFTEIRTKWTTEKNGTFHNYNLRLCDDQEGVLYYKGMIAVPQNQIRLVIQEVHSRREVGHAGIKKTVAAIKRNYQWPGIQGDVTRFINNCHDCRRSKPPHEAPAGLLQPLPIPQRP